MTLTPGFQYLGAYPNVPRDCPALLKNQPFLDLERVLKRMSPSEMENLRHTGFFHSPAMVRNKDGYALYFLAREIPRHKDSWLVVEPGTRLNHSIRQLYWAYVHNVGRTNRKQSDDTQADNTDKNPETKPALLNPVFVFR